MKNAAAILLSCLTLAAFAAPARGQHTDPDLADGARALDGRRYDEALALLQRAAGHGRHHAEADYLLARVYLERPQPDVRQAGEHVMKALEEAPDDLRYLKLRLRQYAAYQPNPATRMEERATRVSLAKRILAQDPDYVPALVERGRAAYDDVHWDAYVSGRNHSKRYGRRMLKAVKKAETYLYHALKVEPRNTGAYRTLMQVYVYTELSASALRLHRLMAEHLPNDPDTWLYGGWAYVEQGEPRLAEEAFAHALALMPPYERRQYEDVSLLLPPDERAAYRQDPERFAARYWAARDPRRLTPANERRNAHLARIVAADLLFGDGASGRRGRKTLRGELLIRYGKPDDGIYATSRYGTKPSLLGGQYIWWRYGNDFKILLADPVRSGDFTPYSPPADQASANNPDYQLILDHLRREVPVRYEHEQRGRRVTVPYVVSAFKGAEGQADVYVAYGVPVRSDEDVPLGLRSGAFAVDAAGYVIEARRSFDALTSDHILPAGATRIWTDVIHLGVHPGRQTFSAEFETEGGATVGYQHHQTDVPDYRVPGLRMSDVMPAYRVEETAARDSVTEGHLHRRGFDITPMPVGVFETGQPVYFYFEVYGLNVGDDDRTSYRVAARMMRKDERSGVGHLIGRILGRGKPGGVSAGFTAPGSTPDDGMYLIMDTQNQRPGTYRLHIDVTDLISGETVTTERVLILE